MTLAPRRPDPTADTSPDGSGAAPADAGPAPTSADELQALRHELALARLALERAHAELVLARRAAHSDALTGLPNRRGFDRASRRALAEHGNGGQQLALLFVDLDGFKAVNDHLGHQAGDELLRVIGARLAHAMRQGDLVCRHGGDEFVCLLPHLTSPARATAIAEILVRVISAPCLIGPHHVQVTASIGLAMYPRDGDSIETLLRSADSAMLAAKPGGGRAAAARRLCASARSDPPPGPTV